MAKLPIDALTEMLHLDDEEVVLVAGGEAVDPELSAHAEACGDCAERVIRARDLLQIEPFRRADPGRVRRLMDRLAAVGAIAPARSRSAYVRVSIVGGDLHVRETDTEVRIQKAVATRATDPVGTTPGVTFYRQIGGVDVELHLVHIPGGTFHLVVGVGGGGELAEWRVVLHRRHRELAAHPAPHGAATFKSLRPDNYRLEIQDRGVALGFVEVDVEAQQSPEETR